MPRSASTGVYTAPSNTFNPAVTDTVISSTAWNAQLADYVTALGHTASTTRALYPTTGQVQDGGFMWGGTAGGTADALTITLSPAITAYAAGQTFRFVSSAANATSTPTLAINGLTATVIKRLDGTAAVAADIPAGAVIEVAYDGTAFRLTGITPVQAASTGSATTTTSATSISLTNASSRVQSVAFTADAQSVVLPDARTLNIGGPLFIINNAGTRTFGVRSGNPNQFTNADFAAATGWTAGTGWAIASGVATKTAGVQSDLTQAITTVSGTSYVVTFTITSVSAGTVTPVFTGGGTDAVGTARSAPGTYTETIVSNGNTAAGFRGSSTLAGSIDNVSITLAVPALLAVVPPGATAECSLTSAATIAGAWVVAGRDLSPALTVLDATLASTLTQTVEVAVKLTDTLSLHFARNASGHPFVFAVDHGTLPATVGTAVLIVASNLPVRNAFRVSATKAAVLLVVAAGSAPVVHNVTVSGTTCTVSTAASPNLDLSTVSATFTSNPTVAQLTDNLLVFHGLDSATGTSQNTVVAVDCSGTNPVAGTAVAFGVSSGSAAMPIGTYRVTNTTALALYVDDGGVAGSPFCIRGAVLSVSGTTISVGTSAGVDDVVSAVALPSCQLTSTSYIVGYYQASGTLARAVYVGVSGTTVTFGTPLTVETIAFPSSGRMAFGDGNANRFQPNLFRLSDVTALFSYGDFQSIGFAFRQVVLTNSAGTLTAGTILYGLWSQAAGGNFPQEAAGFLSINSGTGINALASVTVNGTGLDISGSWAGTILFETGSTTRFGLSGGVRGIGYGIRDSSTGSQRGRLAIFRFRANSAPILLGLVSLPNQVWPTSTPVTPVEVSANRAAITSLSTSQSSSATVANVKLAILEFIA
jgi:hypothetical protein